MVVLVDPRVLVFPVVVLVSFWVTLAIVLFGLILFLPIIRRVASLGSLRPVIALASTTFALATSATASTASLSTILGFFGGLWAFLVFLLLFFLVFSFVLLLLLHWVALSTIISRKYTNFTFIGASNFD